MDILKQIVETLIAGQAPRVKELTQQAIDQGLRTQQVLNEGLIAGMGVVGQRFEKKEFFLPEVLLAARGMHAGMEVLEPLMASAGVQPLARVALGTVKGDIHDIGKNLVGIMLRGAGFEVEDLGIDVPPQRFVDAVVEGGAQIVGMSALTGGTMPAMETTVKTLEAAGLKGRVKTMVGGAIVTQAYADKIGADGYAADAASAVAKAKQLLGLA